MGLFYSNLTVYAPPRNELLACLRRLKRKAFVSPTFDGHTVIYDEVVDSQDFEAFEPFGETLTEELACAALAVNLHDDDVLYLTLFHKGKICDRYDSLPQYFDAHAEPGFPEGGDSELMCLAFGKPRRKRRLEKLLRARLLEDELPKGWGELERHQAIAKELGMPPIVAGPCYASIAGNYVPAEFIPKELEGITFESV